MPAPRSEKLDFRNRFCFCVGAYLPVELSKVLRYRVASSGTRRRSCPLTGQVGITDNTRCKVTRRDSVDLCLPKPCVCRNLAFAETLRLPKPCSLDLWPSMPQQASHSFPPPPRGGTRPGGAQAALGCAAERRAVRRCSVELHLFDGQRLRAQDGRDR